MSNRKVFFGRIALFALVMAIGLIALRPFASHSQSGGLSSGRKEWEMTATTEELKGFLSYNGSNFYPIVKVSVTYREITTGEDGKDSQSAASYEQPYEDLYYHGCDPVGCRRYTELDLDRDLPGRIKVTHKEGSGSQREACAAANAICRLLLDCYVLGEAPARVIAPETSYSVIAQELRRMNFFPYEIRPDEPLRANITMSLWSASGSGHENLYYPSSN
jgi:hypothetical protein